MSYTQPHRQPQEETMAKHRYVAVVQREAHEERYPDCHHPACTSRRKIAMREVTRELARRMGVPVRTRAAAE